MTTGYGMMGMGLGEDAIEIEFQPEGRPGRVGAKLGLDGQVDVTFQTTGARGITHTFNGVVISAAQVDALHALARGGATEPGPAIYRVTDARTSRVVDYVVAYDGRSAVAHACARWEVTDERVVSQMTHERLELRDVACVLRGLERAGPPPFEAAA